MFLLLVLSITGIYASRLPIISGDSDGWGTVLNDYLNKIAGSNGTALNETMVNGTNIYPAAINTTHIQEGAITASDLGTDSVADDELDYSSVTLNDFTNDANYLDKDTGGTLSGSLVVNGNLTVIGSYLNATVTNQYLNGSFLPEITDLFNLGSSLLKWNNIYASSIFSQDKNLSTGYDYALNNSLWSSNYSNMSVGWSYATNSTGTVSDYSNIALTNQSNTFGNFNQSFNGSTLFVDAVSGRVGMGTTSPSEKLELSGGSGMNQRLKLTGTANGVYTGIQMINTATGAAQWDVGVQNNVLSGSLVISDDGGTTKRMVIDRSGKIGINTTNSVNTLNVVGDINATTSIFSQGKNLSTGYDYALNASSGALSWSTAYNGTLAKTDSVNTFGAFNQTFDTSTLFVDSVSDRVGVGTTSPGSLMELSKAEAVDLRITDTTTDTDIGTVQGQMTFYGRYTSGIATPGTTGAIKLIRGRVAGQSGSDLTFWTQGNSTDLADQTIFERMRIDKTGSVGINTTTPSSTLHVVGGTTTVMDLTGPTSSFVRFRGAAGAIKGEIGFTTDGSDGLAFVDSTGSNVNLLVTNTGSVGIGTTTPSYLLHVNKSQNAGTSISVANENSGTGAFSAFNVDSSGGNLYGYQFGGSYTTAGRYIQSSGLLEASGAGGLGLSASSSGGDIRFYTNADNQRMIINQDGSVGINTTAPVNTLNVVGTANVTDTLYVGSSVLSITTAGGIQIPIGKQIQNANNDAFLRLNENAAYLYGGGNYVYATTGGVGIATTSPQNKLNVIGDANITGNVTTAGNVTIDGNLLKSSQTGITASTTQTQSNGALTKDINIVSTVTNANDVVTLPPARAGMNIYIRNNGANTLQIFPADGDAINGAAVNASTTLAAAASVRYFTADTTNWYS